MPLFPLWDGIDRVAFCENAILLEMKIRAQGRRCRVDEETVTDNASPAEAYYPYPTNGLLDDLALVAAGPGGGDNVTATCLEISRIGSSEGCFVVRIARNSGNTTAVARDLKTILDNAAQGSRILPTIISRCRSRVRKHAERLATLCRNVGLTSIPASILLPFRANGDHCESADDIAELEEYSQGTHSAFVAVQLRRLRGIVEIIRGMLDTPLTANSNETLERLTQLAYLVRKSSTARQIIEQTAARLLGKRRSGSAVEEVAQRIGQLSRFVRASHNIEWHVQKIRDADFTISVEDVPRRILSIPDLAKRAPMDLRNRGGLKFRDIRNRNLQAMIDRWPKYREHSEIQLIMFYEENPQIELQTTYVGCDKLSCFLCFNFMKQHGRFHSQGCHQSLYSLWTVRDQINTNDAAVAHRIRQALQYLSTSMEEKIRAQRDENSRVKGVGTGPESVANLSRVTLVSMKGNINDWPVGDELENEIAPTDRSETSHELRSIIDLTVVEDGVNVPAVDLPSRSADMDFVESAVSTSLLHQALSARRSSNSIAGEHSRDIQTHEGAAEQHLHLATSPNDSFVSNQEFHSLRAKCTRSYRQDEHQQAPVFHRFSKNSDTKWKDGYHIGSSSKRRRDSGFASGFSLYLEEVACYRVHRFSNPSLESVVDDDEIGSVFGEELPLR